MPQSSGDSARMESNSSTSYSTVLRGPCELIPAAQLRAAKQIVHE